MSSKNRGKGKRCIGKRETKSKTEQGKVNIEKERERERMNQGGDKKIEEEEGDDEGGGQTDNAERKCNSCPSVFQNVSIHLHLQDGGPKSIMSSFLQFIRKKS